MALVFLETKGDFKRTKEFFNKMTHRDYINVLNRFAEQGVQALASSTPVDTGETASSWYYTIEEKGDSISIVWNNSHSEKGVNIAIILQFGHGTRNGGYVAGRDYINPALRPIFDKMADAAWEEVRNS